MEKLNPNLMVKDVRATVDFYQKNLGFEFVMAVPETQDAVLDTLDIDQPLVYAQVRNGNVELMFQAEDSFKKDIPVSKDVSFGASCSFYIEMQDLEDFYAKAKDHVEVVKAPFTTWYGMKEFYIRDNNGYILAIAEAKE